MYVPPHFPRYRPATPAPARTAAPAAAPSADAPARPGPGAPPLTVEWLVAIDIDAFTARRRAAATMDAQASTRPSPASLRKNGTRAVGHA
ncbi:hypothetical protein [Cellulosimicrobium composti]|uniref:Uncharacterized protein n=1 Tax=Cellulosimicrobium composti TaxID=2672572 RepID=A0A6N7ZLS1_9MICO|nr:MULTISPECIES: hypothetical protein [Cellulosimicrobium]KFD43592.1 hypothetical protein IU11_09155 [Cellulosimicrobium sp. MM]MTG90372.1 hypothetical protein [Cellulosimicrobium composti]TWG82453.1 hypothetical protein L603_000300001890 [Cellulosimicrobium cellulans J34]SMF31949.1 hypothetical protein SAMN02744115_02634 [Cellulosimicrobium cellulans J1]